MREKNKAFHTHQIPLQYHQTPPKGGKRRRKSLKEGNLRMEVIIALNPNKELK